MKPDIEGFFGGLYVRRLNPQPRPGKPHHGHTHHIDHMGSLVQGHAQVRWIEGAEYGLVDMVAPCKLHIPKGRHHMIEAVSDDVIWECTFSVAEFEKVYGEGAEKTNYMLEA